MENSEFVESCRDVTPLLTQPSENKMEATCGATGNAIIETNPTLPSQMEPSNAPPSKKRKLTSSVWEHFDREIRDGNQWAICKYCKVSLKANSNNGTKCLHNHLAKCGRRNNQDVSKCLEKQKQICGIKNHDGKVKFGNFTFDQVNSRKELACAIMMHEYPLSIVEHVGFRKFVASLQPLFKMVSRTTIKKDIMNIYEVEFERLYKVLEKLKSRIAITTDMWTSNQRRGYMSITAHFIDDSWILQNRILRFVYVPTPHTKEELAKQLMDAFTKWNIETKISTITVDNCSTNDGMISKIVDKLYGDLIHDEKIVHMRCCAHILNLVVKDGLCVIEDALAKIRDSVQFWSATPQRVEKFEEMAKQLKIGCSRKLALDCKTRWNSTYLMLQIALEYKDVFPRLRIREKNYTNVPIESDWEMTSKITEKLELFFNTTELFSGRKYPTANVFFINMCQLRNSLLEWTLSIDEIICSMAKKMFDKFEKYWSVVHVVLAVTVILDLRYKMKVVEYYYPMIFGESSMLEVDKIKRICYDLLDEYQSRQSKVNQSKSYASVAPNQVSSSHNLHKQDMKNLVDFLNSSSNIHVKSELDHYLEERVLPWSADFDILNWWKTNGLKYPTLQLIARDFLAVPVSTVASESAFSTGGRVVSLHRSKLHENTLEALMCSQNWLWSNYEDSCSSLDANCLCTIEEDVD